MSMSEAMTDKELAREIMQIKWCGGSTCPKCLVQVEASLRKHRAEVLREAAATARLYGNVPVAIVSELESLAREAEEGK